MECLRKQNRLDLQEKGSLKNNQEFIIGDVLDLQASIGRGGRDAEGKDQVRKIREGIRLANHIAKQGSKVALEEKEDTDKFKSRALTDTSAIKYEVQFTIALSNKIYQGKRRPIKTLTNEVESSKRGMIDSPHLKQRSEIRYIRVREGRSKP